MAESFQKRQALTFAITLQIAFFQKVAAGSGYMDYVTAHFPGLCFLPLNNQKRVARLEGDKDDPQPSIKEGTCGEDEDLGVFSLFPLRALISLYFKEKQME